MNAAVVESFDALPRYATFADPVPGTGELLVEVSAAGLHPVVRALASGQHYGSSADFPFVPGVDGVGRLADGSRVYFGAIHPPFGSFAQRSLTAPDRLLRLPDSLDDATAAAIMNPAMSSWAALAHRAHFQPGESVLIQGATGAAGRLAVQICRRLVASRIVATGRDPHALDEFRSLGADAIIPLAQDREALVSAYRAEFAAHNIDVILDYLWGAPAEALLDAISRKGLAHAAPRIRYIQIGSAAGPTISLPAATLRSSGLELLGSGFGSASLEEIFSSLAAFLKEAAKQPFSMKIKIVALKDVETAWNSPSSDARLVFQPS